MGMDLLGHKPTAPQGEYFRASIRQWPLLVKIIMTLCPKETSPCKNWNTNDGDGLSGPQALALAEALDEKLRTGNIAVALADTNIVSSVKLPVVAEIEAWAQRQGLELSHPRERLVDEGFITNFAEFVRASGGFSIW
jgi:hypothetical protein